MRLGFRKDTLWCDNVLVMAGGFRHCACHVFVCVVYVFRAGAKREVVRCAFRSFVRNVFLRGSWCSDYGGTMGGRDVPIISAFPTKYADQAASVGCRVIPVPGRWAEIDAKIVFGPAGCSTVNCSESVNSFRQNGFCVRFFRPWLSFGGVKSETNL